MSSDMQTVWLIEPGDSDTNKTAMRMTGVSVEGRGILCKDGKPHDLLRMPSYSSVNKLQRSKKSLGLKFAVFTKQGSGAPVPAEKFLNKSKKRLPAAKAA